MKLNKFNLLAAAAASAFSAGTAQAQFAFPTATIVGTGATLPQNVSRQSGDCYGVKNDLGFGVTAPSNAPAAKTLFDFTFDTPAANTLGNFFQCATRDVQPNVTQRYLSTGSGQGVTAFLNNRVSANQNVSATFAAYTAFDGYQFSFSETALSAANLTTYSTALINPFSRYGTGTIDPVTGANSAPVSDTALNLFGAAIQVPFVIAPIAVGYSPIYAKVRNNGGLIDTYRFTVAGARPDGSGGLKLTRAQMCGIYNGVITNWNQLPTNVVNRDVTDPDTFNVPIRLVGRSETSGTTSVYTRAIAAQCTGLSVNTGVGGTAPLTAIVNKFGNSENRLPYDGVTQVAGTAYTGAAGVISPTNSLSGAFFDKGTGAITIGTEATGLFTVANGNDGVAAATALHPDPSATIGDRTINGRVNYVSPEQTLPAALFNGANAFGLNSASLQPNGIGTTYVGPDAKNASIAFSAVQPPQSKGTAGAYCTDAAACPTAYGDRGTQTSWVQASDKTAPLANPAKGYPMIGSSNILLYTCYAGPARRQAVNGYVATVMGKTTKDSLNQAMPALIFSDAVNGLFAKNGLAALPTAWRNAITETFLKNSVQLGTVGDPTSKLGVRNLWIQDKIPTTPTGAGATTAANSLCTGKPGA